MSSNSNNNNTILHKDIIAEIYDDSFEEKLWSQLKNGFDNIIDAGFNNKNENIISPQEWSRLYKYPFLLLLLLLLFINLFSVYEVYSI